MATGPEVSFDASSLPSPAPSSGPSISFDPTGLAGATAPSSREYKYFPAPPIIQTYHQYQTVNNDKYLQNMETEYFLDLTLDMIDHNSSWSKLKKFKKYLKGTDGYEIMYKLLRLFVKRGNTNWYDLKMQKHLVLDYIKHKLSKL